MKCPFCGNEINESETNCSFCSKKIKKDSKNNDERGEIQYFFDAGKENPTLGILAMVFAVFGGIIGLILGIIGVCVLKNPVNKVRCWIAIFIALSLFFIAFLVWIILSLVL